MTENGKKLSKNDKKRQKRKAKQRQRKDEEAKKALAQEDSRQPTVQENVEIVADTVTEDDLKGMEDFRAVLEKFKPVEELVNPAPPSNAESDHEDANSISSDHEKRATGEDTIKPMSAKEYDEDEKALESISGRRKRKQLKRLTVAELKRVVERPDLVESHDVASPDPLLLLHLKSLPNTVAVPRHWASIRKYLQGKRGKERVSYKLPEFIAQTGINKIRAALAEQEANAKARQRARERINPSLGKMDIDYQVLHDAFFKLQTKPRLKRHGDLYYEGAEFEAQNNSFKPGRLSKTLMDALGIEEGSPPPWLLNMQRYGPPPSYPWLKIPGVSAPIPAGASWGMHPGGWGNAPVDQFGRGLYGDVFGVDPKVKDAEEERNIDRTLWAQIVSDDEEDLESEEDDEESDGESDGGEESKEKEDVHDKGAEEGEVDDTEEEKLLDLRKRQDDGKEDGKEKKLFHVLEEERTQVGAGAFAGNVRYRTEDVSTTKDILGEDRRKRRKTVDDVAKTKKKDDGEEDIEANFKF